MTACGRMEDEGEVMEGAWEDRLSKEIRRERVDTSEVAATADKEGTLTSGVEMVEVGALWGKGREQETAGGLRDRSRERGGGRRIR